MDDSYKSVLIRFSIGMFVTALFMFYPIYEVVYFQGIHLSLFQIGVFASIISLFSLLFNVPTGLFADFYGRKKSVLLGYFIAALGFLGLYIWTDYYLICIFAAIIGIGMAFVQGAMDAWMTDIFGMKRLTKSMAIIQSAGSLGLFLSGFLGVYAVQRFGTKIIFIAISLIYLLAIILLLTIKDRVNKKKDHATIAHYLTEFKASIIFVTNRPVLKYFLASMFFLGFALAFTQAIIWIPFFEKLGYPPTSLGFLWSLMAIASFIAPLIALRIYKRFTAISYFIFTIALWIISLFFISIVQSIFAAIALLLLTVIFDNMRAPVERSFFQGMISEKRRATIGSIEGMVISIAGIIGFPIAGFVADKLTPRYTLVLSGVLLLPVIFFFYKIKKLK